VLLLSPSSPYRPQPSPDGLFIAYAFFVNGLEMQVPRKYAGSAFLLDETIFLLTQFLDCCKTVSSEGEKQ
jgi:hypothetical protein